MFERARLPNDILGRIWNLSDTEQRGALSLTEFIVAMHLITSMKAGTLRAVPQTLPAGLYEAASRRAPVSATSRPITSQYVGQGLQRTQSPLAKAPNFGTPPLSAESSGNDWLVSPQDKTRFDALFDGIDKSRSGHINGEQAVQFFSTSGLSEDLLASIWDLADINSEGRLSRDEFAVAMYLIRQQRGKTNDRGDLPSTLPAGLVPPNMRQRVMPPSQPTAPTFDNAAHAPQQPKSAADDLFGLDALSSDPAPVDVPPAPSSPLRSPSGFASPNLTSSVSPGSFRPFVPSSSFGQGLAQQNTGGSTQSNTQQPRSVTQKVPYSDDLLGDNDPEISSKLTNESTELANMSNQISTLRSQMSEVQSRKSTSENEVASTSNQKHELEARLVQFRTQYENEIREVKALNERLNASRAETRKLQQEIAMVEGAYQDLQNQHQQVAAALQADQAENSSLKERISRMNADIAQLRPQVEKLRSEARQQKGLVAINKKQLATGEGEKEKVGGDLKRLEEERAKSQQEEASTADSSKQLSPAVSPAASITSQSTNPFFRTAGASTAGVMSPSIFSEEFGSDGRSNTFDSFFGPSQATSQPSHAPPATTFRPETPKNPLEKVVSPSQPSVQSETPVVLEPPPPPESRQIDSSALPLRLSSFQSDSFSSSMKAHPPLSRAGADSAASTPTAFANTSSESVKGDVERPAPPSSLPVSKIEENPQSGFGSGANQDTVAPSRPDVFTETVPGAFPGGSSAATTPGTDDSSNAPQVHTGPFSKAETVSTAPNSAYETPHETTSALTFGPSGASRANTEFPPLKQHGDSGDEDTDSDEDEHEPNPSPTREREMSSSAIAGTATTNGQPRSPLSIPRSEVTDADSEGEALPTPTTQASPPTYDQSVPAPLQGEDRDSNLFPREYGGLLPSREMVNDPPKAILQSPPEDLVRGGSSLAINGTIQPIPASAAEAEHSKTTATDDFDSAFDDLSEAKEEDGNDGFGLNPRDDYDFNPVFDSPAPPRSAASQAQQKADILKPTNLDSAVTGSTKSFYGGQESSPTVTQPQTASSNHDWDELFSGLDNSTTAANGSRDPFEIQPPSASDFNSGSAPEASSTAATGSALSPYATQPTPNRPTPARAISAGTEHDDPILKMLTNMGYPRGDALMALEKFDYNLDLVRIASRVSLWLRILLLIWLSTQAADYLTSKQ